MNATLPERLWPRVDRTDPDACWLWPGAKNVYGYPLIVDAGKQLQAHRVAYELEHGLIPDGLVIDHLCRTPLCINPAHMEPVTIAENLRRGHHVNREKTHCKRGHLLDGFDIRGGRFCRECHRVRAREWARRQRRRG